MMELKKTFRILTFLVIVAVANVSAQTDVLYIYGDVDINGWKKFESNYNGTPYHQMRLNNAGQTSSGDNAGTGMSSFKSVVESLSGFTITEAYDQSITLDATFLNQYDIIILGSNQKAWSNAERDALNVWVRAGGGLFAYSDSGFGGKYSHPSPAGIHNEQGRDSNGKLTEQFGMRFYVDQGGGSGNNVVTSYTIPHPINNNQLNSSASDFIRVEGEGCSPVRIDPNFAGKQPGDVVYQIAKHQFSGSTASVSNDPDLPNGSDAALNCALAAAEIGSGRVVGFFDRNTFWNSGPGTNINKSGFKHADFARNILTWLEGASAPSLVAGDLRINTGGGNYISFTGDDFSSDSYYAGGAVSTTTATINGTSDQTLYQSERWGNMDYNIPVVNDTFDIILHFAEIYAGITGAGQRVFHVDIEGNRVLNNYDIYADVGFRTAVSKTFQTIITDGQIDIDFTGVVDNAKISAIEIIPSSGISTPQVGVSISGELRKWHNITLDFEGGPNYCESSGPNPFRDFRMDVTFTNGGTSYTVPGYFAADGNAANTSASCGNVWRVHFNPDKTGTWNYTTSFREGSNVAIDNNPQAGSAGVYDLISGSINVQATNKTGSDLRGKGRLKYVGGRYLQWSETGEYFIKGGADSPENFLGYYEFDNTQDNGGAVSSLNGPPHNDGLHHYDPHLNDWNNGDPQWQGSKGRRIIGAINYLASEAINSLYTITMNVEGDGREVYPWTTYNERNRFDVSKLDQWEIVFSHMEKKGLAMHILTQETENDHLLNNGTLGAERKLYYRELIARFGHHNAVNWNLGEEITNSTQEIMDFATFIKGTDPYDHFISLHTWPNQQQTVYTPLLGFQHIDGVSLQVNLSNMHTEVNTWVNNSESSGRQWVVNSDEVGPYYDGVKPDGPGNNHDAVRRYLLWGNIFHGGGGSELYFGYNHAHNDLDCEDFRSRNSMWDFVRHSVNFAQDHIPLDEVHNYNNLSNSGNNYVLAKKGEKYFVYMADANGNATINLESHVGPFDLQWYDPRVGGSLQYGSVTSITGPGTKNLGVPPGGSTTNDWVAVLTNHNMGFIGSVQSTNVSCNNGNNGSATAYGSNGASPITYLWSNGATGQTVNNLSAGSYTVTLTEAGGSTATATTIIGEPQEIQVSSNVTDESCSGNDGSVTANATGGTGSFTYLWNSGATSASLSNLTAGSYSVTVTDANGCTKTKLITVGINQSSANFSPNNVNTSETCFGNDGAIDISPSGGTGPYTFLWSTGATTEDISGLASGTYTVTITDQTGCSDIEVITLAFNPGSASFAVDSSITAASCGTTDGAIVLSVNGGTGPYTYNWSAGTGNPIGNCDEFSEQNGMVHVEFESQNPVPSWTLETTVSNYSDNGYLEWKKGNNSTNVDPAGSGALSYLVHITTTGRYRFLIRSAAPAFTDHNDIWVRFPDNGAIAIQGGNTQSLGTGWFKVYQNVSGNNWTWDTKTVDHNPYEIHADFNSPGTYRVEVSGRSTLFKIDRFTLFHSSVSYNSATNLSIGQSPFGVCTEDSLGGLAAGVYSVEITDANGCYSLETFTVPLDTSSVAYNITANVINESCAGNDGSINLSVNNGGGSGPFTYLWSNGASTEDISNLSAGTYTVTVQDNSGCESVASYTIAVNGGSGNFQTTEVVSDESCDPGQDGAISLTVNQGNGPYTYQWSTGATSSNLSGLSAGNYTVTITDQNGCTAQEDYIVSLVPGLGIFSVNATIVNQSCNAIDGSLDLSVGGGVPSYTYQWSNGETVEDIANLSAGSYTVTVTDQQGCYTFKNFIIGITPGPGDHVLSGTTVEESCFGNDGSLSLAVGAGTAPFSYQWSNGSTGQNLSGISAGSYTVTVTDANGCYDNFSAVVLQNNDEYDFGLSSQIDPEGCVGSNGAIDISLSNGTGNLSFLWSNGATTEDISGIGTGNYTVTITDISGCYMDSVFVVDFDSTHNNFSFSENIIGESCDLGDGSIDLTVNGGVPPYTYTWSNGATTEDISNLSAGNYSVNILDSNNCMSTRNISIPFIPGESSFSITEVTGNASCAIGTDGFIDINTVNGGNGPYSYDWSTGATSANLANLVSGTYAVTISDQNGCYDTASFSIGIIPGPGNFQVSESIQNEGCITSDGAIDITITSGVAPYSFLWSNGASTEDISLLQAGTYSVTITDSRGCYDTASYTVLFDSTNSNFSLAEVIIAETCDLNDAEINLNTSGGIAPYTYSWSNGETTEDISNLNAGTYTLFIVDSVNCVSTRSFNVPFNSGPLTMNLSDTLSNESCMQGSDGMIEINSVNGGVPGYSYLWSNGASTSVISGISAGAYTLTVTDQNGCYHIANYNIGINPGPAVFSTTDDIGDQGCNTSDGYIDITPGGGVAPYSFLWSDGSTTEDLSNINAGNYSVTITDSRGCFDNETYTVNFDGSGANFSFAQTVNDAGCDNNDGSVDITVSGGSGLYTYLWSNGASTEDLNNIAAGTYTVTATDQLGCYSSATYTVNTTVSAANFSPSQNISNETCIIGSNGTINITVGGGPYNFLWSNGATTEDIQNLNAGTYSLTITNAVGCYQNVSYNVGINPGPVNFSNNPIVTDESCSGNDGSITAVTSGGVGPYTYAWSTGSTNATINGLSANTYFLIVTDARGCYDNETYTVGFAGGATNFNVARTISNATCSDSSGAINITVNSGLAPYTYLWSNGATTKDIQGITTGTYSVSITDARGCYNTKFFNVGQNPGQGSFTVTNNLTNPGCSNNNGAINQTVPVTSGPYTFLWSNGATTKDLSGLSAGNYSVTVTDGFGCYVNQNYTLSINGGPANFNVVENTSDETCAGNNGFVNLSVAGGIAPYSFLWSDGSTTQDLSNVPAGTYTVSITDNVGCVDTKTYTVSFSPGQSSAININSNIVAASCALNDGAINTTTTGGNGSYTFVWSNGSTSQNISGLNPGGYTVTVTDQNGCYNIASFQILIDTNALASYQINSTVIDESCLMNDGSIILNTIAGGSGVYTYNWSTGSTSQNQSGLPAGTYILTISDQNGCAGVDTFEVGFDPNTANFQIRDSTVNEACGQDDGFVSILVMGGSGMYTYQWSNGSTTSYASGLSAGTYNVTIADTNGCATQRSFTVINMPGPAVPVISQLQDSLLSSQASTYQWYFNGSAITGATSQIHGYGQTGYYYVQISDDRGCIAISDSIFVVVSSISDPIGGETVVEIYPNPFQEYLEISFISISGNSAIIRVENLLGQIIFMEELNGNLQDQKHRIEIGALRAGMYLLSIETEQARLVKRIVRQ